MSEVGLLLGQKDVRKVRDFKKEITKANNSMANTIVVDLDGVIVDFKNCKEDCDYANYPHNLAGMKRHKCPVDPEAVKTLQELKDKGYYIIINTGRDKKEETITKTWLLKNKIPYDELRTEKPRGFIYIDDLAHKFTSWKNVREAVLEKYTTFEERAEVYLEAQERWGIDSQIIISIEEFGELISALAKRNRNLNGSSKEDIINEIADAMVMIEHLQLIFGKEECEKRQRYKVARLKSWFKDVEKMIEE